MRTLPRGQVVVPLVVVALLIDLGHGLPQRVLKGGRVWQVAGVRQVSLQLAPPRRLHLRHRCSLARVRVGTDPIEPGRPQACLHLPCR